VDVVRGSPNPKHFGLASRLRKALKQSGLSRRALARRAGVSSTIVGYLEVSQRLPNVDTIARLASALAVSAAYLAYGLGEPTGEGPVETTDGMGARLQAVRVEQGLTKASLARLVKLSPTALAGIENGAQSGVEVIEALALALEVSPGWLAYGVGSKVLPPSRRGRRAPAQSPAPAV
jgi:transcriptional regulator with XRE-family HTH domain